MINAVLIMSAVASILTAALLLLRPVLFNRIGASSRVLAWCVVLMVSLVPVRFKLPETSVSPVPTVRDTVESVIIPVLTQVPPVTALSGVPETSMLTVTPARSEVNADKGLIALLVWGAGVMVFLARGIASYLTLARKLRETCIPAGEIELTVLRELSVKIDIYRCEAAPTTMLLGLFKPRLYLPDREYEKDALRCMLMHEYVHFRRKDVLVKWLAFISNAIHWFNPVLYLQRRELSRECELAADEAVIRLLDANERLNYGHMLLDMASAEKMPANAPAAALAADSKALLKERLEVIVNYKKKTLLSAVLSVALIFSLLTTAVAASGERGNAASPVNIGETIQLGGFDWIALEVRDGNVLVISEKILFRMGYHPDSYVPLTTWEESGLRRHLNGEFFDSVFSEDEKARIVEAAIVNNDNPWYGTEGGNDTLDKVFLLSLEEALHYTGSLAELENVRKQMFFISDGNNALRATETPDGEAVWWWLRSTGEYDYMCHVNFSHAAVVLAGGAVSVFGELIGNQYGGVRPAMWVSLQAEEAVNR
ncbi:MAG: M56 family metallopeptidase [Defluviitaleaceae bacterium]|nr:M56 family metallopeptidase [Defluviitaleaceae bacterium]MCL2837148.1 M56 family metallopeptidase [Defluviitaleaceae bacterium]